MTLTTSEQQYLKTQILGRLATARPDGSLQNNPVGFSYDETTGTLDITGRNLAATQKFRNVASTGVVAFVVDDIASRDPWVVRGVEVRGHAEALDTQEPSSSSAGREAIRIHPHRVISWGLDPANPGMNSRTVEPAITTESVEIAVDDGPPMGAYVARPVGRGPFPGVVVGMELFGLSAHVRDVCERLASLGFTALAPDLFHRIAPGVELSEDPVGRERGFALLHQLTRPQAVADIRAAIDALHAAGSTKVGIVGLSVGGHVAYLAAAELDLAAVAVIYGGWIPTTDIPLSQPEPTVALTSKITGRVLLLVGENDHLIPAEQRKAITDELRSAGVSHELVEYPGTGHGFLHDRRAAYDPDVAEDAWGRIQELLDAELR